MHMRMPVDQISKRLGCADHARRNVIAIKDGAIDVAHRFPGETRKMLEQVPVVAETGAEAFGHGKDELSMRHGDRHVFGNIDRGDQHALLMTTRTDAALLARETHEQVGTKK